MSTDDATPPVAKLVTPLTGDDIARHEMVEMLNALIGRIQQGEIDGIAFVWAQNPSQTGSNIRSIASNNHHNLVSATAILHRRLLSVFD